LLAARVCELARLCGAVADAGRLVEGPTGSNDTMLYIWFTIPISLSSPLPPDEALALASPDDRLWLVAAV
jgi:hypothetical protein